MGQSSLKSCLISEEQAIAIYVAECRVLKLTAFWKVRRDTLALCQKVLLEEKCHRLEVGAYVPMGTLFRFQLWLSRIGGYIVGVILSFLPVSLSWRIHSWAEMQAASIYQATIDHVGEREGAESLVECLKLAKTQETRHAQHFQELILCPILRPRKKTSVSSMR